MDLINLITLFVVSMTIAVARGAVPQCNEVQGSCACLTDQGLVDLSALDSKDPDNPTFSDIPSDDGHYKYSYNPCSAFTEGKCTDVALCQAASDLQYPVGDQNTVVWNSVESIGMLVLSYTSMGWDSVT
ncbi:hypothetical protein CAPTEDRAFT_191450, partial [Capitella teleta]